VLDAVAGGLKLGSMKRFLTVGGAGLEPATCL
jgi:hypothetical protein